MARPDYIIAVHESWHDHRFSPENPELLSRYRARLDEAIQIVTAAGTPCTRDQMLAITKKDYGTWLKQEAQRGL